MNATDAVITVIKLVRNWLCSIHLSANLAYVVVVLLVTFIQLQYYNARDSHNLLYIACDTSTSLTTCLLTIEDRQVTNDTYEHAIKH